MKLLVALSGYALPVARKVNGRMAGTTKVTLSQTKGGTYHAPFTVP